MTGPTFAVATSTAFINKSGDMGQLNNSFTNRQLTARQLLAHIASGYSWTAPHSKETRPGQKSPRTRANVLHVQAFALDSDTEDARSMLAAWLNDDFARQYAAFLHTTASHSPEAPRARIVFTLSEPLDPDTFEDGLAGMHDRWTFVDRKVSKANALLFGAKDCETQFLGNVLPVSVFVETFAKPWRERQREQARLEAAERRKAYEARHALESAGGEANALDYRIVPYASGALHRRLEQIRNAPEGGRYLTFVDATQRLASFAIAHWLTPNARQVFSGWEQKALAAAAETELDRSGKTLLTDEGPQRLQSVIDGAKANARPADMPYWLPEALAQLSDRQKANALPSPSGSGLIIAQTEDETELCPIDPLPAAGAYAIEQSPAASPYPIDGEPLAAGNVPPAPWETEQDTAPGVLVVNVPRGKYLGQVDFTMPPRAWLDANTGVGKTTWAATRAKPGERVIVAMSSVVALLQQARRYPDAAVMYQNEKNLTPASSRAFITYDQLAETVKLLESWGVPFDKVHLVIDEEHNFALADYRRKKLRQVLDLIAAYPWLSVTLMSGTPLPIKHTALSDFAYVKVNSYRRPQRVQPVRWQGQTEDGKPTGKKQDTIVELARRHERVLIHLNDKGKRLDNLIAALVAAGIDVNTIATLNADNKYQGVGEHLIEHETVPESTRILIVTNVFTESSNLRTHFNAGIIASNLHYAHAQQFANRLRGEQPLDVLYILHNGDGRGWHFDRQKEQEHWRLAAEHIATGLKLMETGSGQLDEEPRRLFGDKYQKLLVSRNEDGELVPDELGIAQQVAREEARYINNNLAAYRNATGRYNWQWADEEQLIVTPETKPDEQRAREDELRKEYEELARKDYESRLAYVYRLGPAKAQNEQYLALQHSKILRLIERALALYDLTGEDWEQACSLLATATDSTQSYRKLQRLVRADKLRRAGNDFIDRAQQAFTLGDRHYTQQERGERLTAVYKQDPKMRAFIDGVYVHSWAKNPQPRLDESQIDEVLKLLFTVEAKRIRVDGEQVRVWTFTGTEPLAALLETGRSKLANIAPESGKVCHQTTNLLKKEHSLVAQKQGVRTTGTGTAEQQPGTTIGSPPESVEQEPARLPTAPREAGSSPAAPLDTGHREQEPARLGTEDGPPPILLVGTRASRWIR